MVESVPLSEVARIDRKSIAPENIETGAFYVGLENIESGGRLIDVRTVANGQLASSKFQFTKDHVLYGKLRPYLAKIALPDFDGICSTDILPVLPTSKLDRRYLVHFLRQPSQVRLADSLSTGANLPRLSPTALGKMAVPLPSLAEQRRIAAILDKADEIRTQRRTTLAHCDALVDSMFHDMFSAMDIPREKIGNLVRLKSGNFLPGSSMVRTGAYSVYGGNGVNGKHDQFMFAERKLVIGRVGAYCGAVHVTQPRSWVTDNALYADSIPNGISLDYLAVALRIANLNQYSNQSGQPLISGSRINQVEIALPSFEQQQEFSDKVSSIGVLKKRLKDQLATLDALYASLQYRAFLGQV